LTFYKVTLPDIVAPPLALIFAISFSVQSPHVSEFGFEIGTDSSDDSSDDKKDEETKKGEKRAKSPGVRKRGRGGIVSFFFFFVYLSLFTNFSCRSKDLDH
jgi:hypothetical protein